MKLGFLRLIREASQLHVSMYYVCMSVAEVASAVGKKTGNGNYVGRLISTDSMCFLVASCIDIGTMYGFCKYVQSIVSKTECVSLKCSFVHACIYPFSQHGGC